MHPTHARGIVGILLASWLGLPAAAQDTVLEILQIHNRPASSLVSAVEPHVGEGGAVTAHGSSLIVRAARERMPDLRRIVAALDVPTRLLRISVERHDERSGRQAELTGVIAAGGGGAAVAGAARHLDTRDLGTHTQILLLMEGMAGRIDLGVEVPVSVVGVVEGPGGPTLVAGTQHVAVVDGVSVVPRLTENGERVELELALEGGRVLEDGSFEREIVNTTLAGRLGEWIEIASAVEQLASRGSGLLGLSRHLSSRDLRLRVRVDPGS